MKNKGPDIRSRTQHSWAYPYWPTAHSKVWQDVVMAGVDSVAAVWNPVLLVAHKVQEVYSTS